MSEIKSWLREHCPNTEFVAMPSIDLVNQLLKLSETDKDRAIKELTKLYAPVYEVMKIDDMFGPTFCKGLVETYLQMPYLVYDPLDNQTLTVRDELIRK